MRKSARSGPRVAQESQRSSKSVENENYWNSTDPWVSGDTWAQFGYNFVYIINQIIYEFLRYLEFVWYKLIMERKNAAIQTSSKNLARKTAGKFPVRNTNVSSGYAIKKTLSNKDNQEIIRILADK